MSQREVTGQKQFLLGGQEVSPDKPFIRSSTLRYLLEFGRPRQCSPYSCCLVDVRVSWVLPLHPPTSAAVFRGGAHAPGPDVPRWLSPARAVLFPVSNLREFWLRQA